MHACASRTWTYNLEFYSWLHLSFKKKLYPIVYLHCSMYTYRKHRCNVYMVCGDTDTCMHTHLLNVCSTVGWNTLCRLNRWTHNRINQYTEVHKFTIECTWIEEFAIQYNSKTKSTIGRKCEAWTKVMTKLGCKLKEGWLQGVAQVRGIADQYDR